MQIEIAFAVTAPGKGEDRNRRRCEFHRIRQEYGSGDMRWGGQFRRSGHFDFELKGYHVHHAFGCHTSIPYNFAALSLTSIRVSSSGISAKSCSIWRREYGKVPSECG